MISNALRRLRASFQTAPETTVDAAFDQTKYEDLRTIQNVLRRKGVIYKLAGHHLFHRTNPKDFEEDLNLTLEVLHSMGHDPKIAPGVLTKTRFALKCETGLIIQRIEHDLRIFFSI